jgi:hypothetical protein
VFSAEGLMVVLAASFPRRALRCHHTRTEPAPPAQTKPRRSAANTLRRQVVR